MWSWQASPSPPAVRRPRKVAVPGWIRGYDARTGAELWAFHTIPQPGEYGSETWDDNSNSYTGNTAVWATFSADAARGLVYLPVEAPTADFYGGHRTGNNLFSDALVCIDAKTGKRVWHYQIVHHDIWDYDLPAAPVLADITVIGKRFQPSSRSRRWAWYSCSTASRANPCGPSRSVRCRSRTCRARRPHVRSPIRPDRRPMSHRVCESRISSIHAGPEASGPGPSSRTTGSVLPICRRPSS